MAVLTSIATGNFTTAGTWGVVDSTSYLNAENATESLLTTTYSNTRSAAFTPGAIVVSHIGVKLCERIGTTGTMSVHMNTSADHVEVAGTEVTINTADLPSALEADLNGGWIFFKLASPVTLSAATGYELEAKTSSASMVDLWCDATLDNISRAIVTTTTQAPAAGDDLIVAGERTGAGTGNSFTVTMDNTATTDFGAASTSLVTPSLAICDRGTLSYGTTAATNYYLKQSGNVIVYSGGTFNMGTTGTQIPRNSTASLQFDCATNVDFGLTIRNLGAFNAQGLSRTVGNNSFYCKLNTDEAINSTSLGVDTDTGWLDNDEIAVASTTRTVAQCEKGALNGAAGAATLTVDGFAGVGGGLAFAHSGTSPTQAEIILLTRNVSILGASASLQGYISFTVTSSVDIDWTEIKWMGSATTGKRGIDISTGTGGSLNIQYSSLHDFSVASSRGQNVGTSCNNITYSNNVSYAIANSHYVIGSTAGSTLTFDGNIFMKNTDATSSLALFNDVGGVITNNTFIGATANGFSCAQSSQTIGTFSGNTSHSNGADGFDFSQSQNSFGTLSSITSWRNSGFGIDFSTAQIEGVTINVGTFFGNTTTNLNIGTSVARFTCISVVSNGDSTFSTTSGVAFPGASFCPGVTFISCDFSTVSGIKTAHTNDVICGAGFVDALFLNCIFAGTNEVTSQSNMMVNSSIKSQKHDQTAGLHKTWTKYGTITIETTTVHTGGQSVKLTPNNASSKLESPSFYVAVANGATITPTVYVYEDVAYNGARSRLIVKRNDAIGITADTVLDTATAASDAAWEGLTGTTAAATDDGVMEFVVDCDGTAGNLFVDSFSAV